MGATEKIAQFIVDTCYGDIPHDAVEKAKRTALDCVGASLAGVGEPVSNAITSYVTRLGGPGAGIRLRRRCKNFRSRRRNQQEMHGWAVGRAFLRGGFST
jgi:2-methylcitrate dehydratase PrpD